MAREMLKLRKGDQAICIKADGRVELAGIEGKPLIDENGIMQPVILFAAAWARKSEQGIMDFLFKNFKQAVRDGYFGFDAKNDLAKMEKITESAASGSVTTESASEGLTFKPNVTEEEWNKQKQEEKNLEQLAEAAANQDPRQLKQQRELLKNSKVLSVNPFEQHMLPDLPIEQTMKYQDATPEVQIQMKEEESKKISSGVEGYSPSVDGGIESINVGNVTIEEEIGNENK